MERTFRDNPYSFTDPVEPIEMNAVLVGYSMVWGQSPPACSVAAAAPAQLPLLWSLARVPLACSFLGATGTLALPSA